MKLIAVVALACGFVAAPMVVAGTAAGDPCDGAGCVPYVAHDVAQGASCVLQTRYVFGMDPSGRTMVCTGKGSWAAQSMPLIGVRNERQPCGNSTGWAQSPDGIPMTCVAQGWNQNYSAIYFPTT